jgi:hypothetical protein
MDLVRKLFIDLWFFLRDAFLQWVWPFAIYVKDKETGLPVTDPKTGKYAINWVATGVARILSTVTAVWGTYHIMGTPLSDIIQKVLFYLGFVN